MGIIYKYYLDIYYEETTGSYLRLYLEPRDKEEDFDFSKFRLTFRRKTIDEWYATRNYPTHQSLMQDTFKASNGRYVLEIKVSPEETLSIRNLAYSIRSSDFYKQGTEGWPHSLQDSNYKISYEIFGQDLSSFINYNDVRDVDRGDSVYSLSFSESYRTVIGFGTEAAENEDLASNLETPSESMLAIPMIKAEISNFVSEIELDTSSAAIAAGSSETQRVLYNMESSEASTNSYGEPFEVDICDDLEEVEAPFVCPDCVPNENYSEPFWQNEAKGFNYYNEKECFYCVITDVSMEKVAAAGYGNNVGEYISKETPRDDQEDTYLIQALKILGAAYDKTQITSFYKDSLEIYSNHLVADADSGLTKVKICVQKREFELLPPDESPETDDSVQSGGIEEIELDATEFYGDVARIRAGMLVHKTFYETHLLKQKGYLYRKDDINRVPVLSSTVEVLRNNLRDFRKDLFHLIREKGYRVNSFKSGLPFANNKVMKIKIKFDNSDPNNLYKIKFISVKPQGCRYRRIYDHRKPPSVKPQDQRPNLIFQNNPSSFSINLFTLIANFNDINDDFKAIEPPNWHEFMLKYFIPEMALEYGNGNDVLTNSNNALSCALDQFPSFGDFLTASLGSLETVFELLAFEFNKITCAEDKATAIENFNMRFGGTFGQDFKKQFNNRINPNSGIVSYLLTVLTNGEDDESIIGSLTFCEVDGLIKLILECLLGGIPFDKAMQLLVTKMLKDLSARHLGKLLVSLPASKQQEVQQRVEQIIGQVPPEPWSQNFAGGVSMEARSKDRFSGMTGLNFNEINEQPPDQPAVTEDIPSEETQTPTRQRIFDETEIGGRSTYALVTEDLAGATAEQIEQMNVDNKISQVTSVILNAYIQAILESMGVDQLIDYLDKLPISPLLRALIGGLFDTCKIPRLNSFKDVGNLMPKFKVSYCDPMLSISIPKLPKLRFTTGLGEMFKLLSKMLRAIAKKVFVQLLINFLFKIIKALDNILCQGLAALARSDGDFLDVFGNLLCDDPNKGKEAIGDLMASFGQLPTDMVPQALSCLSDSFSRSLSKKEMYLISSGQKLPSNRYQIIAEGVGLSCPDVGDYFPDGKAVEDLCDFFPKLLPADQRNLASELAELEDLDNPVCDLICLDQETLSNWDALRQGKLENLGLSPEQAAEEIDKLNNKALEDFDDILTNATSLQDIIADEFNKMLSKDDPCSPSTPWNSNTNETAKFAGQLSEFIFTPIELKLSREAAGARTSIMGRILSDTRGNVLNTHNFYANNMFTNGFYKNVPPTGEDKDGIFFDLIPVPDTGFYPITVGAAIRDEIVTEEFDNFALNYSRDDFEENFQSKFIDLEDGYRIRSNSINEKINTLSTKLEDFVDAKSPIEGISIDETRIKKLLFKMISRSVVSLSTVNVYEDLGTTPNIAKTGTYGSGSFGIREYDYLLPEISEGFLFGYEEEPLTKDDIVYKRQDGTTDYDHDEEEEILGVAPTGENRYIFLDPKVHGGSFEKPKIYVKPPKLKGLMKIQKAFLDYDPLCDEDEKVVLPFKELKDYHNKLVSELSIDNRLYQEQECRKDLPFDRILPIEGTALLDSLVRATIITHSVDMVLRMVPLMTTLKWKEKNYDSMIEQVLFKKMKKEMLNEVGRSNTGNNKKIRRHRHWNLFLEQVVQAFKRQVELGLITPTQEEEDALYACDKVKLYYKYPNRQTILDLRNGSGNFEIDNLDDLKNFQLNQDAYKEPERFYKLSLVYDKDKEEIYKNDYEIRNNYSYPNIFQLKKFRLQTKVFAVRTMEKHTKILFKRIANQEINRLVNKMQSVVEPQIESLDLFLFSRDKFFLGSTLSVGDLDSERRYTGGERNSLGQIVEPSINNLITSLDLTERQEETMNSDGVFIVERFIRRGKSQIELFSELQFAVSSLHKFRERLQSAILLDKTKKLSEIFSTSCKFGIRISYIFPDEQKEVLSDVSQQMINKDKSYYVEGRSVLPLASFTYDFIDETIENFINPEVSKNNYDTQCLVRNLVKTDDFKELFYNILPYRAPVSLVAAFLYDGFYNSIGHKDGWDTDRAENDADAFNNLEENSLKGTKKMLQRSFESVYIDQDFDDDIDNRSEMNRSMFGFLKNLIPEFKYGLGGKWGRRIVKELDDCDDPVFKFLRE